MCWSSCTCGKLEWVPNCKCNNVAMEHCTRCKEDSTWFLDEDDVCMDCGDAAATQVLCPSCRGAMCPVCSECVVTLAQCYQCK